MQRTQTLLQFRFYEILSLVLSWFSFKFFGCYDKNLSPEFIFNATLPNFVCGIPGHVTVDASSATEYRHFAVDEDRDIAYFCDRNPRKKGMYCYSSDNVLFIDTWFGMIFYISLLRV